MADAATDAARIIKAIEYLTIATVDDSGRPWNTPVYSAFDLALNFYWASDRRSVHSANIVRNPNVFLAIYDSTVPAGTGEGVYVRAIASMLEARDVVSAALKVLDQREGGEHTPEQFLGEMPRRVFSARATDVWINGDGEKNGHFVDVRIAVPLDLLRGHLAT
jgi:general stress protein 26